MIINNMNNKIILYIATSLDGYIARKNGSVDWLDKYNNLEHDCGYKDFFDFIDTVFVGNTTQKQFPQAFVEGGGHKNAGSITFLPNKKDEVIKILRDFIKSRGK